jgi:hypothetical protein
MRIPSKSFLIRSGSHSTLNLTAGVLCTGDKYIGPRVSQFEVGVFAEEGTAVSVCEVALVGWRLGQIGHPYGLDVPTLQEKLW